LLKLSLRGALEALQRFIHAGGDGLRAKFFEEPAPPAWWEDEISVVLDAAACRVDGCAGATRHAVEAPVRTRWRLARFYADAFEAGVVGAVGGP
jgi:hypothetical protein